MISRRWRVAALVMLLPVVVLIIYGSAPAHGTDYDGEGCYCHNNGIGVRINQSDWHEGYYFLTIDIDPGGSSHLHISTKNREAMGGVPVQEWMLNQSDNAKFTFSPQIVPDNSPQDLSPRNRNHNCTLHDICALDPTKR